MTKTNAKNSRTKPKSNTYIKRIIIHVSINTVFNIFVALLMCTVFYLSGTDVNANYFIIMCILCVSEFITGYFSGLKFRKNGILIGVLYNLPFILIMLIISLVLGSFNADSRLIITLILQLLISAVGGIVSVNSRKKLK